MATESGQSIREMAERDAAGEGDNQGQLFAGGIFAGDELSIRDIIKASHKVTATVSMRAAEFPSPQGGLLKPSKEGLALVTYRWEKPELVPEWEDKPRAESPDIKGWKVRQVLKPIYIEKINGEAGVLEAGFAELLQGDEAAAGNLLERLRERFEKAVNAA